MKRVPLDTSIDYRAVVADPRFDTMPRNVRVSVKKLLAQQERVRQRALAGHTDKDKQRARNKAARQQRKRNRK